MTGEGYGRAVLGEGANVSSLDGSRPFTGCCFWFGGLACQGFLEQVQPEPPFNDSWYSFGPYAQNAMGLLASSNPIDPCDLIDYSSDGVLDNADIGGFIAAFAARNPSADINADGAIDNGDIGGFVAQFIACTG